MNNLDNIDWGKKASRIIKVAMASKDLKATQLAPMLSNGKNTITAEQIRNRLSKGNFKAAWFLEVLSVLGVSNIDL